MSYLLLASAIFCEVIGATALKMSDGFSKPGPVAVVLVGYALAFYLLSLCLERFSIGFTYAVWSAVGIVSIAAIGVVFFNEKVDLPGVIGVVLIVAGVLVLNVFSKMNGH
ncbi:MAG: multidrug efflux SMR transporter [Pseudomonadota bacterium]